MNYNIDLMEKPPKLKFSQKTKCNLLLPYLTKKQKILDLGCGNMWLTKTLRYKGYNCKGFALDPPADILANVKTYPFKSKYYDVVIALEMIEHVNCFKEIKKMLKPGGLLILSTPVPHLDWLCNIGEKVGLMQPRGTPHSHLFYVKDVPFKPILTRILFGIVQFGVFKNSKD